MNFDELKNQWGREIIPYQSIPPLELKRSNNAIDKVRRNMKNDFWGLIVMLIIGLTALVLVPYLIFVHQILLFVAWSFYITFSIIAVFFLLKFYRFYKKSYKLSYSMKDNLWWFYYELRSFIDFYYTFNLVALTMGLSCGLSLGYIGANLKFVKGEDNLISKSMDHIGDLLPFFLLFMVVFTIMMMVGLYYAINYLYGKHLKQLKTTLDLLRDNNEF